MHRVLPAILALPTIAFASQNVFSVHDDVLAFPQYEVIFSEAFISDKEASIIIEQVASHSPPPASNSASKAVQSPNHDTSWPTSSEGGAFDPAREKYELMYLNGEQQLCTIPIVVTAPRNETSEAEARAAEQKELARATNRGWELLQDLEGNCLHFISGWWSYSFCYNAEVRQFHQLPPQPGQVPKPDPKTAQYVLGRAKGKPSKHDEWGNEVEVHKGKKVEPPKTELQVKGDTRYLVQKMEGGTTCDLTGKPRRVEVQYHCNPHSTDRIGYIKEVTTCSYLLVVYTARLCSDVAFMPPKDNKAHSIVCRVVVPESEIDSRYESRIIERELEAAKTKDTRLRVGGQIIGEGKWMGKNGARMPPPAAFGKETKGMKKTIIVRAKPKADGGLIERLSDAELLKLDVDPKDVELLKEEVRKAAGDKGWRVEVVEQPGEMISVVGIVEGEEGEEVDDQTEEGSQEVFKDEL